MLRIWLKIISRLARCELDLRYHWKDVNLVMSCFMTCKRFRYGKRVRMIIRSLAFWIFHESNFVLVIKTKAVNNIGITELLCPIDRTDRNPRFFSFERIGSSRLWLASMRVESSDNDLTELKRGTSSAKTCKRQSTRKE